MKYINDEIIRLLQAIKARLTPRALMVALCGRAVFDIH